MFMVDKLKLTNRLMNVRDKSKVFHTSGYAAAQSGAGFGAASTESFSERRAVDENRKFVQRYNNSRILNSAYGVERARKYVPRTGAGSAGGATTSAGRGAAAPGASSSAASGLATPTAPTAPAAPPARRSAPIRLK